MNSFIMAHKRKKSESSGGSGSLVPDLVTLGILTKPIAEFSNSDVGTTVFIPYNDTTGKFSLNEGRIEFEVVGVNHHTSSEHSQTITLMTKNIIRTAAFDAKEPSNSNSDRKSYGNNRWSVSNIRQWLNSSGEAGKWFTKQHDYDEPPTSDYVFDSSGAYAGDPGFLAGFSDEVIQHFTDITNTTALNEYDRVGSETLETTVDKVFLPSWTELIGSTNYGIEEGSHLSVRYPINDYNDYYKLAKKWNGSSHYYWMRSNVGGTSYYTIYVDGAGENYYTYAYDSNLGIAPIIVLH